MNKVLGASASRHILQTPTEQRQNMPGESIIVGETATHYLTLWAFPSAKLPKAHWQEKSTVRQQLVTSWVATKATVARAGPTLYEVDVGRDDVGKGEKANVILPATVTDMAIDAVLDVIYSEQVTARVAVLPDDGDTE